MAADPGQCTLDNPALGLNNKALIGFAPGDDLNPPIAGFSGCLRDALAAIACISENDFDKGKARPCSFRQQAGRPVTVLNIGRMHIDRQQQAQMVGQDMALNALCLFPCIVADRVDRAPPFEAERAD